MCVVNKKFELLKFDLKYSEISLTLLLGLCACVCSRSWSLCEVVLVPYMVGAVVAVTVMRVLLDASMLRECGSARVTAMLMWVTREVWLR